MSYGNEASASGGTGKGYTVVRTKSPRGQALCMSHRKSPFIKAVDVVINAFPVQFSCGIACIAWRTLAV